MIIFHQSFSSASSKIKRYLSKKSGDSVHFYITLKGEIISFFPLSLSSPKDICSETDPFRVNHYSKSLNSIITGRKKDPSKYSISIEFEGIGSGYLFRPQFEAAVKTVKYINTQLRKIYGTSLKVDKDHFIGAYKVIPALCPFEPGLDFPIAKIIKACKEE